MDAKSFINHLTKNLIPFWNRLKDEECGGFYGYVDADLNPDPVSVKGVILNSRILWFYSNAYLFLKEKQLLDMADHAYRFLSEHCYDSCYGGVFWAVNYDGTISDDTKHTYNQAFAIYALSSYYRASKCEEALHLAYSLYHVIEEKCKDSDGYLEAFTRDFRPASNEKLSENGVLAERTMNTLLHVLEAYTELYKADGLPEVKNCIQWILDIFVNKVYNPEKQICEVFFDMNYHSLLDLESFGHDIETSWLIDRSCEVLGDSSLTEKMHVITSALAHAAYRNAYDSDQHALNNEREGHVTDRQKIWWVQAESVIGFYNEYEKHPENKEYLLAAENIWNFICTYVIDPKSGEWFESIQPDNKPYPDQSMVHPWKCPYHNGRMCLEMISRLSETNGGFYD